MSKADKMFEAKGCIKAKSNGDTYYLLVEENGLLSGIGFLNKERQIEIIDVRNKELLIRKANYKNKDLRRFYNFEKEVDEKIKELGWLDE